MMETKNVRVPESVYLKARGSNDPEIARKALQFMQEFCGGEFGSEFCLERTVGDDDIPVEELAIIETPNVEESAIVACLSTEGIFAGGTGYAPVPETDNLVYAGIFVDNKGAKVIKVMLRDINGKFLPPIEMSNSDFLLACQNNFKFPDKKDFFYREICRFQKNAIRAVIDRLPFSSSLDYMEVLEALKKAYGHLPVNKFVPDTASVETIYRTIVRYAYEHKNDISCAVCQSYFRLTSSEMENVSELLGMTTTQVCKQLKKYGLLYLTPSSVAYQTKVRVNGEPTSCYCVRKPRQEKIDAALELSFHPTEIEEGAVNLNDGRVELSRPKYKELFGEEIPCADGETALQSAPQEKPEV